jgi:hypothetical protein
MGGHTDDGNALRTSRVLLVWFVALGGAAGCNDSGDSSPAASSSASSLNISGVAVTQAQVGQQYSFTPSVKAAVAASVGFSISNKPNWASFNTTTGELMGTPTSADVGTDAGIAITASTGSSSASLPAFTITVTQAGAVVLSWQAPTTNTDGSPLSDLAGYTINYGTSQWLLNESATVANASATSYTFQNLSPGTWYFTVSTYNSTGAEGLPSDMVSTTLN